MDKFYMITHGVEEKNGAVLYEDNDGLLFETYRAASEYLISKKDLVPFYGESGFCFEEYDLKFEYVDEEGATYYGYIHEMSVVK